MATSPTPLDEAWKALIATAMRRNVVVAVGDHRAEVEIACLAEAHIVATRGGDGLRDENYRLRKALYAIAKAPMYDADKMRARALAALAPKVTSHLSHRNDPK